MKEQLLLLSILSIGIAQQTNAGIRYQPNVKLGTAASAGAKVVPFVFTNASASTIAIHPYNNQTKGKVFALLPPGSLPVRVGVPQGVTTVAVYQKLPSGQFKQLKIHNLKGDWAYETSLNKVKSVAKVPNGLIAFNPSKKVSGKVIGRDNNTIKIVEQRWFPVPGDPNHFLRLVDEALDLSQKMKLATK